MLVAFEGKKKRGGVDEAREERRKEKKERLELTKNELTSAHHPLLPSSFAAMLANPSATMEVTSTTPPCFSMAVRSSRFCRRLSESSKAQAHVPPPCLPFLPPSSQLPTEMIREIIFFLGRSSTIPLSRTCRRLMNVRLSFLSSMRSLMLTSH